MCSPGFISTFGLEGISFTSLITAKVKLYEGFSSSLNSENSFPFCWYDAHGKILLRLLRDVQTFGWPVELKFNLVVFISRFPPLLPLSRVVFYWFNNLHLDLRLFIIFNILFGHIFLFNLINSRDEFLLFLHSEFLSFSCVSQVNLS